MLNWNFIELKWNSSVCMYIPTMYNFGTSFIHSIAALPRYLYV
jgi:hypothetical protein